jgi:hypothetical protein
MLAQFRLLSDERIQTAGDFKLRHYRTLQSVAFDVDFDFALIDKSGRARLQSCGKARTTTEGRRFSAA